MRLKTVHDETVEILLPMIADFLSRCNEGDERLVSEATDRIATHFMLDEQRKAVVKLTLAHLEEMAIQMTDPITGEPYEPLKHFVGFEMHCLADVVNGYWSALIDRLD